MNELTLYIFFTIICPFDFLDFNAILMAQLILLNFILFYFILLFW